ncbi:arsenite methyltransferase-like isoform X1 [Scyliorhinus canicula]|uniref:arsenite methyltransferase-like isoform X1 n=1 Tax=Scyliorhinus canicula TaxID=7830 RepID=UPI0018F2FAB6|nr:arsenite methyltransferase-like isoform X1 [Scyliorhinus canicula]
MNRLTKRLTQQLGKPSQGLWGWLVNRYLEKKNRFLEVNAVKLCNIQPESVVLEVGFGPGLGLQEAAKRITYPKGKLYGVDYSDYMHSVTSRRLQADIRTGKVTLFLGSVEHIPLEDNVVDRVFHCNCYYFWPNQRAGSKEIHRVMKPGGMMVTTLNLDTLKMITAAGLLKDTHWPPEPYMAVLRDTGFVDVRMEDKQVDGKSFQAIFATANKH